MSDARGIDLTTSRRGTVRCAAFVVVGAALVGAAGAVLGPPDLAAAQELLIGGGVTRPGALTVVALAAWCGLGVVLLAVLASAIRSARSQRASRRRPWLRSLIVAVGAVLLAAGVARHVTASPSLCCGSVQEARELAR